MTETKGVRTANETVNPLELTEDKVYVRSNIVKVEEPGTDEMSGFNGFSYDEIEYTKDEYIATLSQRVADANTAIDDLLVLVPELVTAGGAA